MDFDSPLDTDLGVNSLVELTLGSGNTYGIIRWVGTLPDRNEIMAGLELVMIALSPRFVDENPTNTRNMYRCHQSA